MPWRGRQRSLSREALETQEPPMSNFPGQYDTLDTFAFRAAVEAVVGVTLGGEQANEETVPA